MLPKINVKNIAIALLAIFIVLLIFSILNLAHTSAKNLEEVGKLKSALVLKDIELKSVKEQFRIESSISKLSERTTNDIHANEKEFSKKLAEQKDLSNKKASVLNKRLKGSKAKVEKNKKANSNIKHNTDVDEYIKAQIEESKAVIDDIIYVHCLITQSEQKNLDKETEPCKLSTL